MYGSSAPQALKAHPPIYSSRATKKTAHGPYANGEYPFHGASKRARKDEVTDHKLSGIDELMRLLDGQELVVKQATIERLARLTDAPYVGAVRTIIMQEVQRHA